MWRTGVGKCLNWVGKTEVTSLLRHLVLAGLETWLDGARGRRCVFPSALIHPRATFPLPFLTELLSGLGHSSLSLPAEGRKALPWPEVLLPPYQHSWWCQGAVLVRERPYTLFHRRRGQGHGEQKSGNVTVVVFKNQWRTIAVTVVFECEW